MSVYLDGGKDGQVLYAVNSPFFKRNVSVSGNKKRCRSSVLHLGPAKTQLSTVTAAFVPLVSGIAIDAGEFSYQSPDQLLTIVNAEAFAGLVADESDSAEILISEDGLDSTVYVTSIHAPAIT